MRYLQPSLESLLTQTHPDVEIIAIDDGSTDGSQAYLQSLRDRRVRLLSAGSRGIAAALNLGLSVATGEFIARQDADDVSYAERLARQSEYLTARPDIAVLATVVDYIDAVGAPIETDWTRRVRMQHDSITTPESLRALLPLTCCITHGSVMMRASALRAAGGYRERFAFAQDYDLWLRLAATHRFAKLPTPLYALRLHGERASERRRTDQLAAVIRAKLEFVRRAAPQLPMPARMYLTHANRGARAYRDVGRLLDFTPADSLRDADVVIVTDGDALETWADELRAAGPGWRREGNVFLPLEAEARAA
jgi:glycosyltransferase involved in cell wall biosynthesis